MEVTITKVYMQDGRQVGYDFKNECGACGTISKDKLIESVAKFQHKAVNFTVSFNSSNRVVRVDSSVPREEYDPRAKVEAYIVRSTPELKDVLYGLVVPMSGIPQWVSIKDIKAASKEDKCTYPKDLKNMEVYTLEDYCAGKFSKDSSPLRKDFFRNINPAEFSKHIVELDAKNKNHKLVETLGYQLAVYKINDDFAFNVFNSACKLADLDWTIEGNHHIVADKSLPTYKGSRLYSFWGDPKAFNKVAKLVINESNSDKPYKEPKDGEIITKKFTIPTSAYEGINRDDWIDLIYKVPELKAFVDQATANNMLFGLIDDAPFTEASYANGYLNTYYVPCAYEMFEGNETVDLIAYAFKPEYCVFVTLELMKKALCNIYRVIESYETSLIYSVLYANEYGIALDRFIYICEPSLRQVNGILKCSDKKVVSKYMSLCKKYDDILNLLDKLDKENS